MNLIQQIESGNFRITREPAAYNGFGHRHEGALVYVFNNGVQLRTYTGDSWFLYIDNQLISFSDWPKSLTGEKINAAFAKNQREKLASL